MAQFAGRVKDPSFVDTLIHLMQIQITLKLYRAQKEISGNKKVNMYVNNNIFDIL